MLTISTDPTFFSILFLAPGVAVYNEGFIFNKCGQIIIP